MVKPFPSKTHIGNHALHPETLMLNYGYDPQLSEGAVKSIPDLATLILATLTVAVGCLRIHAPDRIIFAEKLPTRGNVPNQDSEAGHGETVSV